MSKQKTQTYRIKWRFKKGSLMNRVMRGKRLSWAVRAKNVTDARKLFRKEVKGHDIVILEIKRKGRYD